MAITKLIGTDPNQVPVNGMLGTLAFQEDVNFDALTNKTAGTGNYTTTGNFTGAALIPTGATVPVNGIYLPSANVVGVATNSSGKVQIDTTTQPVKEIYNSTYYPIVTQADIGSAPDEISLNGMLGTMAFQDSAWPSVDRLLIATAYTVATLPSSTVGTLARVTDANAPSVGSTVAGGGAAAALCWYNGTNWTVIGV